MDKLIGRHLAKYEPQFLPQYPLGRHLYVVVPSPPIITISVNLLLL
ncbi:MAG: hypothetical protein RL596_281 [Bacteroidota bacterium]|jgi:hypothetical protein